MKCLSTSKSLSLVLILPSLKWIINLTGLPSAFKQTYECFILCVCVFHFSTSALICFQKTCLALLWWLIVGAMLFPLARYIFFSVCLSFIYFCLFFFWSLLFSSSAELDYAYCCPHSASYLSYDLIGGLPNWSIKYFFWTAHSKA